MNSKSIVLNETRYVAIGQLLCTGAMVGVFALLEKYDATVLTGAVVGMLLATANFFIMALATCKAADKAENQDVKGGQALIHMSYLGRMASLFLILALCAKSGKCNVLTLVIPLVFTRPILTIAELFKKKGGQSV